MNDVHFEPAGQVISVLTASLFAINAFHYLEGKIPDYVAFGLVLPGAALVHFLVEFLLLKFPIKFRAIRRLVSRTSSIEGYWFQVVHSSDYPYSIVCVEFDSATESYIYHGINYKADLSRNAMFRSTSASIDESGNSLTFHFDATVRACSDKSMTTETARGYGNIRFMTEGTSSFVRGIGEFFERKPEANWHTFELHRIARSDVRKALGQPHTSEYKGRKTLGRPYASDNQDYDKLLIFELEQQMEKAKSIGRGGGGFRVMERPRTEVLEGSGQSAGAIDVGPGEAAGQPIDRMRSEA